MKIIAILEDDIAVGGGFHQALNAILQVQKVCRGRFDFQVLASGHSDYDYLRSLGIDANPFSFSVLDRLLLQASRHPWWHQLQGRLRLMSSFEKHLQKLGCDLVFFSRQSELSGVLQRLNFITTLFDLCHRDATEFPEVREFGQFQARERYFQTHLTGAISVLTDSPTLADAAARRYGVDRERLLPMPFAPAGFLDERMANDMGSVLRKHGLAEGYLFYPAQFWAHKNHIRILQALVILRERGRHPSVVFAGGDKGNRRHVEGFAERHDLRGQVRFLGFVPAQDMRALYEGCSAVVMPTYFGPTNLPALEAWLIGKPLVYSRYLAEQSGDAAIGADPDDAQDLARAIEDSLEPAMSAKLVALGRLRLQQIEQQRSAAEAELLRRLQQFESRRQCWE
jgi:glycosyltransferase involved in cell wall biosynthesis